MKLTTQQIEKSKYIVSEKGRVIGTMMLSENDAENMKKNGLNISREMKIQEQKYVWVGPNITGDFSENGSTGTQMTETDAIRLYGEKAISSLERFIPKSYSKSESKDEDSSDDQGIARSETYGLGNYAGDVVG